MSIDTQKIRDETDIVAVIGSFVALERRGATYVGLCPFHADGSPSLHVSAAKKYARCYACGWPDKRPGDVIDFIQDHLGLSFKAACEHLGAATFQPLPAQKAAPRMPESKPRITSRPPADADNPDFLMRWYKGKRLAAPLYPAEIYPMHDVEGYLIGWEVRYIVDGKKEPRMWSWGCVPGYPARWGMGHFNAPRPLFGLDDLLLRPNSMRVIHEAPRKAAAARLLMPSCVHLGWTGGAHAWKRHDWKPLQFRSEVPTIIWPDADSHIADERAAKLHNIPVGTFIPSFAQPGQQAALSLARFLSDSMGHNLRNVAVIDVNSKRDGWDAWDAVHIDKWTPEQAREWIKPRIKRVRDGD